MVKAMSPEELAEAWEITETEVMQKINNTLQQGNKAGTDRLPESFMIRKYPDTYRIIIPDGYRFNPLRASLQEE